MRQAFAIDKHSVRDAKRNRPKIDLYEREIENPLHEHQHEESLGNPKKTKALFNRWESAVESLFSRRAIDAEQMRAATTLRKYWEASGATGAKAMDYSKDIVDGGGDSDPACIRVAQAVTKLVECRNILGARGYGLLLAACCQGSTMTDLAGENKRQRSQKAHEIEKYLEDLVIHWGYRRGCKR